VPQSIPNTRIGSKCIAVDAESNGGCRQSNGCLFYSQNKTGFGFAIQLWSVD
jgi:hypothetical protein